MAGRAGGCKGDTKRGGERSWGGGGAQQVRCGPAAEPQPRPPSHGPHRQLSSLRVRSWALCSHVLASSSRCPPWLGKNCAWFTFYASPALRVGLRLGQWVRICLLLCTCTGTGGGVLGHSAFPVGLVPMRADFPSQAEVSKMNKLLGDSFFFFYIGVHVQFHTLE